MARSRLLILVLCAVACQQTVSASAVARTLEEEGENEADLSGYTMEQGFCFRTKIQEDGDDDGNSYFYNGAYRAQYNRYSSFFMCENGSCDYDQRYVAELNDYLQIMTNYINNMCNACSNNCRRRLEEEEGDEGEDMAEDWQVNCNTCKNECKQIWNNNGQDDETNYLECQYSQTDGDIDYYSAPSCQDGVVTIGHFYDEDCTVKAGLQFNQNLKYSYFRTMESIAMDCSSGLCDEVFEEAIDCTDGGAGNDDDDAKICKAAKEAHKTRTFYRKPWFKKVPVKATFFLLILLSAGFATLSYVYFVRHRRSQVPLANLDGAPTSADYGQMA